MSKQMVCGIMRDINAELSAYKKREQAIHLASIALRNQAIGRICARYELESDEFYTAEQKALHCLGE